MKKIREFAGHQQRVGSISWNNSMLTSGSRDRNIFNRDVRVPGDSRTCYSAHKQEVCGLKWNPEGTLLASGGNDNKLMIWDQRTNTISAKFNEHQAAVKAIAWSPHTVILFNLGGFII